MLYNLAVEFCFPIHLKFGWDVFLRNQFVEQNSRNLQTPFLVFIKLKIWDFGPKIAKEILDLEFDARKMIQHKK